LLMLTLGTGVGRPHFEWKVAQRPLATRCGNRAHHN
jgi:hypothetical protein